MLPAMDTPAANDDTPPPPNGRTVPIIGTVDAASGRVTITAPRWRASPRPAPRLVEVLERD